MSHDALLTDDYVAEMLARDAKDCSLKFSAMGMEAFRSTKKPATLPKPNTRFLHNIIKRTDSHNKALLAKETAESRARLEDLEHADGPKGREPALEARNMRKRQMGDIHAILGGKRKREAGDGDHHRQKLSRAIYNGGPGHNSARRSKKDNEVGNRADDKPRRLRFSERESQDRRDKIRQGREAESSAGSSTSRTGSRGKQQRSRSPTRRLGSSLTLGEQGSSRKCHSRHRSRLKSPSPQPTREECSSQDEDSDPLDDLIGPPPPPKYRGRGTIGGAAALDRRFSESYDPRMDVQMDEDGGDWDEAIELFRDQQKLRLHQDQRLKKAGFTDEQIQRATGAASVAQEAFVWTKAGEKREWDKGKATDVSVRKNDTAFKRQTLFSENY